MRYISFEIPVLKELSIKYTFQNKTKSTDQLANESMDSHEDSKISAKQQEKSSYETEEHDNEKINSETNSSTNNEELCMNEFKADASNINNTYASANEIEEKHHQHENIQQTIEIDSIDIEETPPIDEGLSDDNNQDVNRNSSSMNTREEEGPTPVLPGAYRVPGIGGEPRSVGSRTTFNSSLPQAIPVNPPSFDDSPHGLYESDVIHGEVVTTLSKPKRSRRNEIIFGAVLVIFVIAVVVYLTTTKVAKQTPMEVTNPDDSSSEMSDEIRDRTEAIKRILIPFSGEDVFDDRGSPQFAAWMFVAVKDPQFVPLSNTKRIIQRYALVAIAISLVTRRVSTDLGMNSVMHVHECELSLCNDKDEIIVYQMEGYSAFSPTGTITREIGLLTSLTHLLLNDNGTYGTIPTEIGLLKNLQTLDLGDNNLSGTIPTEIEHLTELKWLFLQNNHLNQIIPSQVGNLKRLFYLDVSNNTLSGTIPSEIGNLDDLKGLALYDNKITGDIGFLCDNNFTRQIFGDDEEEISYIYSVYLGLLVSCADDEISPRKELMGCSCCDCV